MNSDNQYLYNSKELDQDFGLDWYHFGARMYDATIGIFPSVDRFADKFAFQSPYVHAANNPIKFIDINGDSVDVFLPDGSHLYTYDDGKEEITGRYFQDSNKDKDGNTVYTNSIAFSYNDVTEDRWRALGGDFTFNVVNDEDISNYISEGVSNTGSGILDHYNAGRARGSLDYYGKKNSPIESNTMNIISSSNGITAAYNSNDFGNYLTSASLRQLGYSLRTIKAGAHFNNVWNGASDHGSRETAGWRDSPGDQRAITNGYHHFKSGFHSRPIKN